MTRSDLWPPRTYDPGRIYGRLGLERGERSAGIGAPLVQAGPEGGAIGGGHTTSSSMKLRAGL